MSNIFIIALVIGLIAFAAFMVLFSITAAKSVDLTIKRRKLMNESQRNEVKQIANDFNTELWKAIRSIEERIKGSNKRVTIKPCPQCKHDTLVQSRYDETYGPRSHEVTNVRFYCFTCGKEFRVVNKPVAYEVIEPEREIKLKVKSEQE